MSDICPCITFSDPLVHKMCTNIASLTLSQYTAQEAMANVASKHGIELTFFHGKGGTVGRGGNPALYRAILSHPPNTINGRFRVTEQGEMIRQNFGTKEISERSLDIYTSALLREYFTKRVEPKQEWRDQMERISDVSCEAYRHTVREDPRFVPYFRQATPELELGLLNIGSRPSKRNPKGGVESLRAIPWVSGIQLYYLTLTYSLLTFTQSITDICLGPISYALERLAWC